MNKLLIGLIIFFVLALNIVSAVNIGYVVKTTVDSGILTAINQSGYKVDVITSARFSVTNWSKYDVLVVNNDHFGSLASQIPVNQKNSVVLNTYDLPVWGWLSEGYTATKSTPRPVDVFVSNNSISITSSLGSKFMTYETSALRNYVINYMTNVKKAPSIKTIATQEFDFQNRPNGVVIGVIDSGSALLGGKKSVMRGVFFGLSDSVWTLETERTFKNSLVWALEGLDKDHDNFPYNLDCNDLNPNINPNASDIAYNGIDENCDGYDMADVDHDGYCKLSYTIQNKTSQCSREVSNIGTDCNDLNETINPGTTNLLYNCVNDAPVQNGTILNQSWNEDTNLTINLNDYFSDPENDLLRYDIYASSNNPNIALYLSQGLAVFIPTKDWTGFDWIIFNITDGNNVIRSNRIDLAIAGVNDAPVLINLQNISVVEGQTVQVIGSVSDIDSNNLTFSYGLPLNSSGAWQTRIGDAGSYRASVSVSDGQYSDSKFVNINVNEKIIINEFVSNSVNEWVELYNPGTREASLEGFALEDSGDRRILSGKIPPKGFYVVENLNLNSSGDTIVLKLGEYVVDSMTYGANAPARDFSLSRDQDGTENWRIFERPTKGLSSNVDMFPPIVELLSADGSTFNVRNVNLDYKVVDNKNTLSCQIFIGTNTLVGGDTREAQNNSISNFIVSNLADGNYLWNIRCFDGTNRAFAPQNRTFRIDAPNSPIFQQIGLQSVNENDSLNFTISATDSDAGELIRYSAFNLPSGARFDFATRLFSWTPSFSQSGNYDVSFVATDSSNLSTTMNMNINVAEVELPPRFTEADRCSAINDSIRITIREPKKDKKFEIGEEIDIQAKVNNYAGRDISVDVRAYLYDITNDKISEESIEESIDIDRGKSSEVIEFKIKVPKDINKGNNYTIYVIAQGDNLCNNAYNKVVLERAKESWEIRTIEIRPEIVGRGDLVDATITVRNLGTKKLDGVYVRLFNSALGIDEISEDITLERYGQDDSDNVKITFRIPENISEEIYDINVEAIYNSIIVNSSKEIVVRGDFEPVIEDSESDVADVEQETIYVDGNSNEELDETNVIRLENNGRTNIVQVTGNNAQLQETGTIRTSSWLFNNSNNNLVQTLYPIDIFLLIAIIMLIIAISFVANRR